MITEAVTLLTTPCYLTCTIIEVGTLLTTHCFLACTMVTGKALTFSTKSNFFKNN